MKRTNFPGRKNRRRMEALTRLTTVEKRMRSGLSYAQCIERDALKRRIVPMEQALNTRSKKRRAHQVYTRQTVLG